VCLDFQSLIHTGIKKSLLFKQSIKHAQVSRQISRLLRGFLVALTGTAIHLIAILDDNEEIGPNFGIAEVESLAASLSLASLV